MASISIGPGGVAAQGNHQCSTNNFLADQGNPLGSLIETVTEQRLTGMTKLLYPSQAVAVDRVMPMRANTSARVDGNKTYRTAVGYEGLLNSEGVIDITPSSTSYNNPTSLLQADGTLRSKNIGSSANNNAEACNPVIDGPMPIVSREEYGRRAYATRLPIPPMCFADYTNKEAFHMHLAAVLGSVENGTLARWAADQQRWIIANSRFNAAPVQQSQGDGRAKLPVDAALFTSNTFGRVPQHYGSADWMAGMLRLSEIDPRQNLTIHLPVSIFKKYKEQLIRDIGINIYEGSKNLTAAVNGFTRDIQNESIIYQDEVYGRKLTFIATTEPVYVEVEETGTGGGQWTFQEPWIHRDSETAGQVFPRHNPNWGIACSNANRTLAAIVQVCADGVTPFYKEPLPLNNPASALNSLIEQYAKGQGSKVNTTLGQMYPSSVETVIFTGLEAQVWMLDPINERYRAAGHPCAVASNLEGTWIGGYTKIAAQFVENDPRALVNFLLRVPATSTCVDLVVACEEFAAIDAAGAFDPELKAIVKQTVTIPEPEAAEADPAGTVIVIGKTTTVTAPCTGTKEVSVLFRRIGGTSGALSVTVAGTPSTHGGTVPGTVTFADGVTEASLTWDIDAWACTTDTQETETFVLTFSGADLDPDAFTTRRICIKCNTACPADCEGDVGGCASC